MCDLCNLAWRDEEVYAAHMAEHAECPYCEKLLKHARALEQHLRDSKCGYDHVCDLCNLAWRDEEVYAEHMAEHVECPYCKKLLKHEEALEQHLRDSKCGYDHVCNLCNLAWRDEEVYAEHMAEHVECPYCKKLLKHEEALEQHLRDSKCGYDHVCNLCNLAWRDEEVYAEHMAEHVECPYCKKLLKHEEALEQHLRDSKCGYDHVCNLCNLAWRDEEVYAEHMAEHVECPYCKKLLKHEEALEQHLRDSKCGYDHVCNLCNLAWRDEEVYAEHMAEHVECPYCKKLLKHEEALEQHLRDSKCGYDHVCDLCNLAWRDEAEHQTHLEVHGFCDAVYISPMQVYFSHDSISSRFRCGRFVQNTFREILSGQTSVSALPLMQITWRNSKWWAFTGNRRLWVFRELAALGAIDHFGWRRLKKRCPNAGGPPKTGARPSISVRSTRAESKQRSMMRSGPCVSPFNSVQ